MGNCLLLRRALFHVCGARERSHRRRFRHGCCVDRFCGRRNYHRIRSLGRLFQPRTPHRHGFVRRGRRHFQDGCPRLVHEQVVGQAYQCGRRAVASYCSDCHGIGLFEQHARRRCHDSHCPTVGQEYQNECATIAHSAVVCFDFGWYLYLDWYIHQPRRGGIVGRSLSRRRRHFYWTL